jgi:hypothetical protein
MSIGPSAQLLRGFAVDFLTCHNVATVETIMEPDYVARFIVNAKNSFSIVPNFKWKIIYYILKVLPESLVAKLP